MSYEVCKRVSIVPAPENDGTWTIEFTGHPNNVWPRTDETFITHLRYKTQIDAAVALVRDALRGMLQGPNRFSKFASDLFEGRFRSHAWDAWRFHCRIHDLCFNANLAYSTEYIQRDGIEKDDAKAERARNLDGKCERIMDRIIMKLVMERWPGMSNVPASVQTTLF